MVVAVDHHVAHLVGVTLGQLGHLARNGWGYPCDAGGKRTAWPG